MPRNALVTASFSLRARRVVAQAHEPAENLGRRAAAQRLGDRPGSGAREAEVARQHLADRGGARRDPPAIRIVPEEGPLAGQATVIGIGVGMRRRRASMLGIGNRRDRRIHVSLRPARFVPVARRCHCALTICRSHNISDIDQFFAWADLRMAMDSDALLTFVTIHQAAGFSSAAEILGRSQPAISRRIALLEDELGVPVFERAAGGVVLSEAGRTLLPHAERVLAALRDAASAIEAMRTDAAGRVAIVTVGTLAGTNLTAILEALRRGASRRRSVDQHRPTAPR